MQIKNMAERSLFAVSLCAMFLLAGCGKEKVLEFRNAEIVNGKIYENGANKPFSGTVTNINGFLNPVIDSLINKLKATGSGLGIPLHGYYAHYFCEIDVSDGIFNGKAICRSTKSEAVLSDITFVKGVADGPSNLYVPGKSAVLIAGKFKDGRLDGKLEIFNPENGKLVSHQERKAGELHGKIFHYTPDGSRLFYQAVLTDGLKDGVEESFDVTTGKRNGRVEWRTGKVHGSVQQWDSAGILINDQEYENGVLVSDALQAKQTKQIGESSSWAQACVDQRIKEHRSVVGSEAMINAAQLEEWETICSPAKALGGR